jgi:Ca2+-binding RTX toxin-like protein
MSVHSYLNRLRRWARPAAKPRQVRAHLGLETLEDRLVLSTLAITGTGHNRVLTYQADQSEANKLEISLQTPSPGQTYLRFQETGKTPVGIVYGKTVSTYFDMDVSLFDSVQVNLMDANNPDTVDNTLKVISTDKSISVVGGNGGDTITLGAAGHGMDDLLDTTLGTITVDGGTGKDKLILDDRDGSPGSSSTGPNHYNFYVNGASVERELLNNFDQPLGVATGMSLANMENLEVRASKDDNSFYVASTLATTPVEIKAGDGDNTIRTGNMDLLAGKVTVHGEGGTNSLIINDTSAAGPRNYVLNTDSVKQGATTVALDTLSSVEIDAPNQVNTFDVQSADPLMPLTLKGGTKSDTVTMSDSARPDIDTYNIKAGSLERWTSLIVVALPTAYVNYSGIDKLVVNAGSGSDVFAITDTAQPSLELDGGGGTDTLDYSTFAATSPVTVNLTLGNATKVSKLSNVENANGGSGDDILVGDGNANVLQGNDGRDLMIGGKGADVLRGGAGQDLMIAGSTDYDTGPFSASYLRSILGVWAGKGTASDRANQLRAGIGVNNSIKLDDTTTVHLDDTARDQLFGDDDGATNATDWFWALVGTNATDDVTTSLTGEILK